MASINVQRGRLYLLATVPRRDGRGRAQQRIPLYLDDQPANQITARRRLRELERQLAAGSFCWADWLAEPAPDGLSWTEAIRRLHRKRVELGRTSERTWELNYMGRLRQIPGHAIVTTASMEAALQRYSRDQCSYKELYYLLVDLAKLVDVPFPQVPTPTYSSKAVAVPDDDQILAWVAAADPIPRWYFGMMATYGLRPHEIEGATFLDDGRCGVRVPELNPSSGLRNKTGYRDVIAMHPEWVELFDLTTVRLRPRRSARANRNDLVAQYLFKERQRLQIPWRPYALRHAYAARLWRVMGPRLDLYTAARLMGHSQAEHEKTYRAHINPHTVLRAGYEAYDQAMDDQRLRLARSTRPPDPARREH